MVFTRRSIESDNFIYEWFVPDSQKITHLLAIDTAVIRHISEDGRFDEPAVVLSTDSDLGFLFANLDEFGDSALLRRVSEGAEYA